VELRAGDAVLIRTGWIKHYYDARAYISHHGGCPGLVPEGAELLVQAGAAHVGGDTVALEQTPSPSLPVHQLLVVKNGIHIIEVLNLEELAADGVSEFVFMVSPLKIRGGTASPVRPLALT
jgi:kynurenine formamidase